MVQLTQHDYPGQKYLSMEFESIQMSIHHKSTDDPFNSKYVLYVTSSDGWGNECHKYKFLSPIRISI